MKKEKPKRPKPTPPKGDRVDTHSREYLDLMEHLEAEEWREDQQRKERLKNPSPEASKLLAPKKNATANKRRR